jgi:hypothetical protein
MQTNIISSITFGTCIPTPNNSNIMTATPSQHQQPDNHLRQPLYFGLTRLRNKRTEHHGSNAN